ncbi:MAG: hypothetical protein KJ623_03920 [Nanoarchaeota archaeon]|nr:hypothetical protein [Nanoarchaeota archaeon]
MNKTKKGVSPLIATVLIIGFTIVLAAVVMQWGGSFVRDLTEKTAESTTVATECIGMNFEIVSAKYFPEMSLGGSPETFSDANITFKVTSNVDKKIKSFVALLQHKSGSSESLSTQVAGCEVTGYTSKECKIDTTLIITTGTDADSIKLIPMIELSDGSAKGCTIDAAKTYEISIS